MNHRLAVLAMWAVVVIYGANFALSRLATTSGFTPSDMAVLRFGVAGPLLLPFFLRQGWRDCAGVGWGRGILLAFMSGVPMVVLMNVGLSLAPAAHGAAIQPGTVAVMGVIVGAALAGAMPSRVVILGIAVVVAGLASIGLAGTTGGSPMMLWGDLAFLAAGALWGFYPFLLQRWKIPALTSTAVVSVLSFAYVPVYALTGQSGLLKVDTGMLLFQAVNQGIFNVILGLWLWASAVRVLGAEKAQRFPPLIPVFGTILAIPILGEWPGLFQVMGVVLIVSGLALASFGERLFRPAKF